MIEGGVLAAAYQIHDLHKYWASVLLIMAASLLFFVLLIMSRDILYIEAFWKSIDDDTIPNSNDKHIGQPICETIGILSNGEWDKVKGRHVGLMMMIGILIIIDLIAALRFLGIHCPCLFSN